MYNPPPPRNLTLIARVLVSLHEFYASNPDHSLECDLLLAHIYEQNTLGTDVSSTTLVRDRRFGTLPTVTSYLHRLCQQGWIEQKTAHDRRIKLLRATKLGQRVLEERAELLANAGV